jgi:hypothetical protein
MISSLRVNPWLTPSTMLATRVRLRPWRSRERRLVLAGATSTEESSWLINTPSGRVRDNSPLGPFTVTAKPLRLTVTLAGTGIGALPIRDMDQSPRSIDVAEHFAADTLLAGVTVAHHTF